MRPLPTTENELINTVIRQMSAPDFLEDYADALLRESHNVAGLLSDNLFSAASVIRKASRQVRENWKRLAERQAERDHAVASQELRRTKP